MYILMLRFAYTSRVAWIVGAADSTDCNVHGGQGGWLGMKGFQIHILFSVACTLGTCEMFDTDKEDCVYFQACQADSVLPHTRNLPSHSEGLTVCQMV